MVAVAMASVGIAGEAPSPANAHSDAWIAQFQRYAAQKQIEPEYRYAPRTPGANAIALSGVLRALPPPQDWPQLRRTLSEATSHVPAEQALEKQRLQAGAWLLAYLVGDRAALETELTAVATAAGANESNPSAFAVRRLKESLAERDESVVSLEKQLQAFEAQLVMLEPVDEAAVKAAVGGEENFARLKQLTLVSREMQGRYIEIYAEYQKTKDEISARAKMEALQKEYSDKNGAAIQALTPYRNNPLVIHYVSSMSQNDDAVAPDHETHQLQVPDLVAVVGRERAAVLVRRALRASANLMIERELAEPTRQLVRELAMAEINTVKVASWGLIQDDRSAELFEAYFKTFPPTDTKDYQYRNACGYYLASLIHDGRSADAVKFVTALRVGGEDDESKMSLPYDVTAKLEQTHAEELWKFLHGWLAVDPGAREWDRFNRLSVQLDRREELKALIKELAETGGFNRMDRLAVQRMQADAEMATGQIAAAAQRLRALIQSPAGNAKERSEQRTIAWQLLKLADLQSDQAGFASTLAAAEAVVELDKKEGIRDGLSAASDLAQALGDLGHYAESSRIGRSVLDAIPQIEAAAAAQKEPNEFESNGSDDVFKDLLAEQLRAEVELGHWKEARALLQESPWWNASDIGGLLDRRLSDKGKPLGYYAARVSQTEGDVVVTRRILEAQLTMTPSADSIYESYLAVAREEALPLLEKLAAADHYEERPLIWKARLQMDAKQWDAAIVTLQQAISIDPSDGEEGRGDRMRVYAFMSVAMAAKGDVEKATFFANVVKAIRVSETADRWYEIGAYAQAIDLYREALGFFQDAYCIQSRLAIRLADAGKMDEAAEHYRRAFELMPDSFGRVESHCFGCEHVFEGKKSQGVAEEVFAHLLKARPDKPQLHYLSGYLREEQERLTEAAEFYRHAVELDPLYLNAWDRLAGLDRKLKFSATQRDDLLLKLVELDPASRHASPDFDKVADLPKLWRVLDQAGRVLESLPAPAPLGELKASAVRVAQSKDVTASSWETGRPRKDFARVILDRRFVQALQVYLATLNQPRENKSAHSETEAAKSL